MLSVVGIGGGIEDGLGVVFGVVWRVVLGTSTFVLCPAKHQRAKQATKAPRRG